MVQFFIRGLGQNLLSLRTHFCRTYLREASKKASCNRPIQCKPSTKKRCPSKPRKPKDDCKKKPSKPKKKPPEKKKKGFLNNKVALITGGSQGIGYALAKEMLKRGIRGITIADVNKSKGCEVLKELTCKHGEDKIIFIECDVADCNSVDWAFKKTIQYHDDINIVINNAGIMNDIKWDRQMNVNMGGCLVGSLLGMQYMAKSCNGAGGVVINVASIISLIPSSGCPVHTMTQHGIVGFSRALGYKTHFKRTGVKIIAYCPGLTNTKILKEAKKFAINENFAKEFSDEIEDCEYQKPESVAKGILQVMEKGKSGSVWVSECDEPPFEIKFPTITDLKPKPKSKPKKKKRKSKSKSKCKPKPKKRRRC